ncbi:phage tail tape measure protein [Cytobacillus purgationiresistens]|uniref:TP901 family phage tail tape measure protein n=1 Tax=Cytobacillus purgationiresistens TaxID=863449 RepID=A0ABU0AHI2_9BACI|nr:phage tail tape measure protein [Cytobacillus purgationiresistens]MDQ0270719.1 TP901 family phage tail tape measure protein [Cytobacillus purgationiresistens]
MISSLVVRIGADITRLTAGLATASRRVDEFAQRNRDAFQAVGAVGVAVSAMGVAAAAGIGYAVKVSSDFESAFAGVKKTVDATDKELEGFRKGILEMAKEMPASAEEIATVAEAAGQLGIKNEAILSFTKTMVNMGVATNMSSDEAATALARLANITQMPQEKFENLGSSIVALGNNFATTETEIVNMSLRLAGQGKQIGLTEAQITALATAMSSVGIEAEAGGTAMSTVMKKISKAVDGGGKSLKGFAEISGMSSTEFEKAWKEDAIGALNLFIEGLGKSSKEGKNLTTMLDDLGIKGIRESDTLLRLSGATGVLADAIDISTQAWKENSALTNEANERYETFESKLQILQNKLKHIVRIVGDEFKAVLVTLMTALDPVIDGVIKMAEKFSKLHPAIKTAIVLVPMIATALALVIGPLLILVGMIPFITAGFAAISAAAPAVIGAISAIALPITLVIAAIVGLVSSFTWMNKNVEWFRKSVDYSVAKMKEGFLALVEVLKTFVQEFKKVWSNVGDFMRAFLNGDWAQAKELFIKIFVEAWESLKKVASKFGSEITKVWGDEFNKMVEVIGNLKTKIPEKLNGWKEAIVGWFKSLPSKVKSQLNSWWAVISGWFVEKRDAMTAQLTVWETAIIAWFKSLPAKITSTLSEWGKAIEDWTERQHEENIRQWNVWRDAIKEWFASIPDMMREKLSAWGEAITTWFKEIPGRMKAAFEAWKTSITDWYDKTKETISTKLSEWGKTISEWFKTRPKEIYTQLGEWWTKMAAWFSEIPARITAKLSEWWTAIKTWFAGVPNKSEIKDMGKKMVDKVAEGNKEKKPEFIDKLGKIIIDVAGAALAVAGVALLAAGRELVKRIIKGIKEVDLKQIGADMIRGLISGMGSMLKSVKEKATEIANAAAEATKSFLRIKSPSRLFKQFGVHTGEGFIIGLDSMISGVERASNDMANAAVPSLSTSYGTPSIGGMGVMSSFEGSLDVSNSGIEGAVDMMNQALQMMSGMQVVMDSERVGTLVAPSVGRNLARDNSSTKRRKGQR